MIKDETGGNVQVEESATHGAKIIPFPGVTLTTPDDDIFQTRLEDFLREMGYIE